MRTVKLVIRILKLNVNVKTLVKFIQKSPISFSDFVDYAEEYNDNVLLEVIDEIVKYGKLLNSQ